MMKGDRGGGGGGGRRWGRKSRRSVREMKRQEDEMPLPFSRRTTVLPKTSCWRARERRTNIFPFRFLAPENTKKERGFRNCVSMKEVPYRPSFCLRKCGVE